jgi:hypothetical protein
VKPATEAKKPKSTETTDTRSSGGKVENEDDRRLQHHVGGPKG